MKLCPDCVSGTFLPGTPRGKMVSLSTFSAYLASPSPTQRSPLADKRVVVLFTDVFGLPLGNPKIMADSFAEELGLDVWVPDMFDGNPALKNENILPYDHQDPGSPQPWWKFLGFVWIMLSLVPTFYLGGNAQRRVFARMRGFVEALRMRRGVEMVGAVGYCYGGAVIASLVPCHLLDSAVIAHPGGFDPSLVESIDFPASFITCEEDFSFTPAQAEEVEARFSARAARAKTEGWVAPPPEYEFKRYMGTRHGFAIRPALELPRVKEAFGEATEQAVGWFRRTLLEV